MSPQLPLDQRRSLNLGSGRAYDPEAVNVDITADTEPDVIHDLNINPWPLPDDRFSRVDAIDVIEHLQDPLNALNEIHRICCNGAVVHIVLPHFSSANAYTDPTHHGFFGYFSLDYVTGEHYHNFYTQRRFEMRRREIVFDGRAVNRLVRRLANRRPWLYEQRWAWIFPAWFLVFELEVLKRQQSERCGSCI